MRPDPARGERVYLDDAGGAPILAEVSAALAELPGGNPASLHAEGQAARAALDRARDRAASALGVEPAEIVFCASGTEACNLAILGCGRRLQPARHLVTWAAEHQAVLASARQLQLEGIPVDILPVDGEARADPGGLAPQAGLVSLGLANNEVGTCQPVAAAAARAREVDARLHIDMCQGPRWMRPPIELADLASFSGHKLGAGRGGLIFVRRGVRLQPLIYGGPQEWGLRAGREDVAAATAVAVALEACATRRDAAARAALALSGELRSLLADLGGRLTGGEPRLPNYASATFPSVRGEDLLLALDLAGVAVSSGSACASGSLDPSHVLLAMGMGLEESLGSLRLTVGYETTEADVRAAGGRLREVLEMVVARA